MKKFFNQLLKSHPLQPVLLANLAAGLILCVVVCLFTKDATLLINTLIMMLLGWLAGQIIGKAKK